MANQPRPCWRELDRVGVVRAREILNQRIVRSPIDGVVTARTLGPGEYAFDQGTLLRSRKIDPLYVEVYILLKQFGRIRTGMFSAALYARVQLFSH